MGYAESLLYMLDAYGSTAYKPDPRLASALELLLVLHAEQQMDCCTAAVRHLASR
jgi:citrate synthase